MARRIKITVPITSAYRAAGTNDIPANSVVGWQLNIDHNGFAGLTMLFYFSEADMDAGVDSFHPRDIKTIITRQLTLNQLANINIQTILTVMQNQIEEIIGKGNTIQI